MKNPIVLLTSLFLVAGLSPVASATGIDTCQTVDTSALGCFVVASDSSDNMDAERAATTYASISIQYTRTATRCTATITGQVDGSSAFLTYDYEIGLSRPFVDQSGGINVAGPIHQGYGPRSITVARGVTVQAHTWISSDLPGDNAGESVGFRC